MQRTTFAAACVVTALLSGCSQETVHEQLTRETVQVFKEVNEVLASVTDVASVEAAKPKLEALVQRKADIAKRLVSAGPPSADESKKLEEKYGQQLIDQGAKMQATMLNLVTRPDVALAISAQMQAFSIRR